MKKKRLEQEFETSVSDEDRSALDAFIATLPTDEAAPEQAQPKQTKAASGAGKRTGVSQG